MSSLPQAIALPSSPSLTRIDTAVLRESLRIRCKQSTPALSGVTLFAIMLIALWEDVPLGLILAWQLPYLAGMVLRVWFARRILGPLDNMPNEALARADLAMRWSSIVNQALGGAGIWIVGLHGTSDAMLFVTFAILIHAVGAMINLSSDYRSFRDSLPVLLVQPALFWITAGASGIVIVGALAVLGTLMILSVRRTSAIFAESIGIRMEKDGLLEEIKAQNETIQHALAAAEQANRAKSVFLAAASHDLRQPLFAISVLAETLLMHKLPEEPLGIVTQQLRAIDVLRSFFDNLLDLSRFEAGGIQPVCRPVRLLEVMQALDVEFSAMCRAKGLAWTMSGLPVSVVTDPDLLLRMLGNLLANAVRYTAAGHVALSAHATSDHVTIEVADSGPGIDPVNHRKIFEEFTQLENPHRDRDKGIGLGLSIVRRIDELLQTRLTMQSAIGKGTRFCMSLPIAPANSVTSEQELGDWTNRGALLSVSGLRVWLIEDDPMVRSALAGQLKAWGCAYRAGTSRAELERFHAAEGRWPDAVILDDMLGAVENGLDIARWLLRYMSREQILIVTGNPDPARMKQIYANGIDWMPKPVAAESLQRWLATIKVTDAAVEIPQRVI